MPNSRFIVSLKVESKTQMPEWLVQSCLLLAAVAGLMTQARELWGPRGQSDARGGDVVFAFLVAFFGQRKTASLRQFSNLSETRRAHMAALVGRKQWITQSTVSTALSALSQEAADRFCSWLLLEATPADLACTDLAAMRCAQGLRWHLFDYDPTVYGMRQRALPEGPDLPDPVRRAEGLGARGHSGRKRAELVCSRAVLQHVGTGFWVGNWANRGNASSEYLESAIAHINRWCERIALDVNRAILRFDGGVRGGARRCRNAGLHFVTRDSTYDILGDDAVRARLSEARWYAVPDSLSGPRRAAADLGEFESLGGRIVVSRFPDADNGVGRVVGDERYELFVTSLDAASWPAAELVALYYGRAAQENHFAREDNELNLDHPFCRKVAGFQVATSIGMLVWNLKTHLGAQLSGVDDSLLPPQQPHAAQPVAPPKFEEASDEVEPDKTPLDRVAERNFEAVFKHRQMEGWSWDVETQGLKCPNSKILKPRKRPRDDHGTILVLFRASKAACRDCPFRSTCTTSTKPDFRREVGVAIPRAGRKTSSNYTMPEWTPAEDAGPGPLVPLGHHLRLAELRRAADEALNDAYISITLPGTPTAVPKWLAESPARRQNRRRNEAERRRFHELQSPVKIAIAAGPLLEKVLLH